MHPEAFLSQSCTSLHPNSEPQFIPMHLHSKSSVFQSCTIMYPYANNTVYVSPSLKLG